MADTLSASERSLLAEMAGAMIPADAKLGMPAANDPVILADIEKSIGRELPLIREAFASFQPDRDINAWYAAGGPPAAALGRAILSAYYRDDRVLLAVGHEARAPFPKGHVVEQGDWSLVDVVRQRSTFWRDDRTGKRGS